MPNVCTPVASPNPPEQVIPEKYVNFLHPGFPKPNIFLQLIALDTEAVEETESSSCPSEGSLQKYGIHHATALDACRIIADNQPGFLATANDRASKVDREPEGVLFASEYYYFLDNSSDPKYPLVTEFADWTFPETIAERWNVFVTQARSHSYVAASNMSARVHSRDEKCRISGYGDALQNAHIIPQIESLWFNANSMRAYNSNPTLSDAQAMHDMRNGILLRQDIYWSFDYKMFVAVPKMGQPTVHFLHGTITLGTLYHNKILVLPSDMRGEFWFARFAYNLLPLKFFWAKLGRPVVLREKIDVEAKEGPSLPPPSPRSRSKRKHNAAQGPDEPPAKRKSRGKADMTEVAASVGNTSLSEDVSEVDEEAEYFKDLELQRQRFPFMAQEHNYSDDPDWNSIAWYPGWRKVYRQMRRYMRDHPSVTAVSEPDKAVWVDPEDP